jgi:uncharacterized protein YkvS
MSYTINYTNGGTLLVLADQTYDNESTSLTLVGKNSNAYGQAVNSNFVHLLENFANVTAPISPLTGQLWYDSISGQIKVYTNNQWKSVGSPIISSTQPGTLISGDFWFDSSNSRLWYYDGISLVDLSKGYNSTNGKSGAIYETVVNTQNNILPLINFYTDGVLMGWFSSQDIVLNQSANPLFSGIATTIQPGLTLNPTVSNLKFRGLATNAESIAGLTTATIASLKYLLDSAGTSTFTTKNTFQVNNNTGLKVLNSGTSELQIRGNKNDTVISNNIADAQTNITYVNSISGQGVGISVNGDKKSVSLLTTATYMGFGVAVKGDMIVDGNFMVLGTSQEVLTSNLYITSKNIYLSTGSNSDANSDGAGIVIQGTIGANEQNAISLLYNASQQEWSSSRHFNLSNSAGEYRINDVSVLDNKGLHISTITNIVNFQSSSTIVVGRINDNFITITTGSISAQGNLSIKVGTSVNHIDVNQTQIINAVSPPAAITTSTATNSIVATKGYVDTSIAAATGGYGGRKPYTLTLDVTGFTNVNDQVLNILNQVLPVSGGDINLYAQPIGARCSVLCATYSATTATFVLNLSENKIPYTYDVTSTNTVTNITTTYNTATTLVTDVAGLVTVTGPLPTVTYKTKLFQVIEGGTSINTVYANYVSGTGTVITVNSTAGITPGAIMSRNGFDGRLVVEVLDNTQILISNAPIGTPSSAAGDSSKIQFDLRISPTTWQYLRDISY